VPFKRSYTWRDFRAGNFGPKKSYNLKKKFIARPKKEEKHELEIKLDLVFDHLGAPDTDPGARAKREEGASFDS
jgi:hypothetical protein